MNEKIKTLHPDPRKRGIKIDKDKYDLIRTEIITELSKKRIMKFMDLQDKLEEKLQGNFEGNISWYLTTIKLDMEARKEIERVPGKSPQHLRLRKNRLE